MYHARASRAPSSIREEAAHRAQPRNPSAETHADRFLLVVSNLRVGGSIDKARARARSTP
jgi:hypothetical protein